MGLQKDTVGMVCSNFHMHNHVHHICMYITWLASLNIKVLIMLHSRIYA